MTGIVLLVANLVPLYGVFAWDWQVFPLILLYWLENLIMGALQMIKLAALPAPHGVSAIAAHASKLFLIPFFSVHYSGFCLVHGLFIFGLFQSDSGARGQRFPFTPESVVRAIEYANLEFALAALALSHAISLVRHFFVGGERNDGQNPVGALMVAIYARVIVLHVTIIFSGFIVLFLGSPRYGLLLLIALKSAIDYAAHKREHAAPVELPQATSTSSSS